MKQDIILFDIDGTVAARTNRGPYDWDRVGEDIPRPAVIRGIRAMVKAENLPAFGLSGRKDTKSCRIQTVLWLNEHLGFYYQRLYMRAIHDNRPDNIIKSDIYTRFIKPYFNVVAVWDDRDQVVKMWREEHGLDCFQVAPGNF